jgi:hypothetical protein
MAWLISLLKLSLAWQVGLADKINEIKSGQEKNFNQEKQ